MDRDVRLRLLFEEYSRLVSLVDDIVQMRQSMARLELYMIVMVVQVAVALLGGAMFMCLSAVCRYRKSGEYKVEHRFERKDDQPTGEKKQFLLT